MTGAHTLIEGDNLSIMTRLSEQGAGYDLVYMDPPYNTGTSALGYEDRRGDWQAFFRDRVVASKDLMQPGAVLIVSVDDNKQHYARFVLDEVFGERSFVATMVWLCEGALGNSRPIRTTHEYVHVYVNGSSSDFSPEPFIDPSVPARSTLHRDVIRNSCVKNGPSNKPTTLTIPPGFPCLVNEGVIDTSRSVPKWSINLVVEDGKLTSSAQVTSGWANRSLLQEFIDSGFQPVQSRRGEEVRFEINSKGNIDYIKERPQEPSHWLSVLRGLGTVREEKERLESKGVRFQYPKPVRLMKRLLSLVDEDALILDAFAGSGSTLEAAMQMNAGDGGSRSVTALGLNELSREQEKVARDAGLTPGEDDWERLGIFRSVTEPRSLHDSLAYGENVTVIRASADNTYQRR